MRGKTGTQTGGSTAHAHAHNGGVAGEHMIQLVAGEDVLPLLYPVSAGLHCVGLSLPVQHLEGGQGREQNVRTPFYTGTIKASFVSLRLLTSFRVLTSKEEA